MILGIDPKVDYAFKYLLGRDSTRGLLIDVLNQVLNPPPGHEILEIELLNPFNVQETQHDKLSILDTKARDQSGRQRIGFALWLVAGLFRSSFSFSSFCGASEKKLPLPE